MKTVKDTHQCLFVGVAGGSGSGKTWLANWLASELSPQACVISQDWYYRHIGPKTPKKEARLNFDHPRSIETSLLVKHLERLRKGHPIETPRYHYATHSRKKETHLVLPHPVVIVEGILVLHFKNILKRMDYSIFVDVPADIRLARRVERDVKDRQVPLLDTLRMYHQFVRPMHERFVQPSSGHADAVWNQLTDKRFPKRILRTLKKMM